jgi:chemotaxis signal transduction protein
MKMMKKAETSSLLKQTNALGNYLDEMLHDATQLDSRTIDQPVKPLVKLESCERALLAEVSIEDSEESKVPNIIEITERTSVEVEFEVEVDPVEADLESHPSKLSNKIDISQFPIQCLMFRVGHNLLSLPLIELNGVVRWTDELTQLPQSPDWVLGILKHRDSNLRVLDSSKLLGIPTIAGQTPSHILILSDNVSAISCDILEDVVTLEYNDIQWQPETGNALMHGTIRETLAYLLRPSGIIDSLNITSEQ